MWENVLERVRPRTTIMRVECWTPKATNTHSQYVILIAFPMQQWLQERGSVLRYPYIGCLVLPTNTVNTRINPLAPEFSFKILAHSVFKM